MSNSAEISYPKHIKYLNNLKSEKKAKLFFSPHFQLAQRDSVHIEENLANINFSAKDLLAMGECILDVKLCSYMLNLKII